MTYVRHLTLDTGDQRDSYREEVRADVLALLRPLLAALVEGERVAVPGDVEPEGCTMTGARAGEGSLLVTVWGPPAGPVPLATVGVAPSSRASAALWRRWIGGERDDRTPAPPWCAVRLHAGLAAWPAAAAWLGDLERCLAWAWVSRGGE